MKFEIKDPGSAITHFIGMLMAAFAATPLLIRAASNPDRIHVISLAVFIASMILLYAASTTYHTLNISERANRILRKIDHCMIFVLIAGSYTPVCLIVLGGRTGYTLCALVWGVALAGILLKAFWVTCPKWFSSILYIAMGWICVLAFHAASERPLPGGLRLAAGRRHHLYGGRRHLRPEAADLQRPAQEFRLPRNLPPVRHGRKHLHFIVMYVFVAPMPL